MEAVVEDQFLFPNKSATMANNTKCGICYDVKKVMIKNCPSIHAADHAWKDIC